MANSSGEPSQSFAMGVTVIFAIMGFSVVLIPVKAGIFPVPEALNPMLVLSLVQLYVVPATALPSNIISETVLSLQVT